MTMHPFVNTAVKAARTAGNIIIKGYERPDLVKVHRKDVKDFVTDIDRAAEEVIVHTLQIAYPHHSFLCEENGKIGQDEYQWIIDPLDGTINFIHNLPFFAISIALSYRGRIEHAVIYDPLRDDLFTATRGQGAQRNNYRIRVSARYQLPDCLMATGTPPPKLSQQQEESYYASFNAVSKACISVRRSGSSVLDLAYVAAGLLDGYWKLGLKPWDLAAGSLLIREAGGLITDIHGGEDYLKTGDVIVANPKLFKPFFQLIQPYFKQSGKEKESSSQ